MKLATFVNASYEKSSTHKHQGNRDSIKKYLNSGYRAIEERNGFWVLTKPASVIVYLKDASGKIHSFNMKSDILDYYHKQKISESLVDRFISDAQDEKIKFYMDDSGYCIK